MEERAVLANLATIIAKDILIDEPPSHKRGVPQSTSFSLLSTASDDDEAETFALIQQNRRAKRKRREIAKSPKVRKVEWQYAELNLLHRYVDIQFEAFLHMQKLTFLKIEQSLEEILLHNALVGGPTSQTVLSLSMWKLATDEHFEEISRKFQVPWSLCQQLIRKFWNTISDNYERFIKWPNSLAAQQSTLQGFQELPSLSCFPKLFGVIAVKRLDVFLECEHAELPVVMQIICNAEHKIIDCYVELAPEYCFDDSPIGQTLALNARTMPSGSYLIGSTAFPLKSYLIRPIEAECFRKDTVFNSLMEPAFHLAEDVLDSLARRFNALYALEARDLNEVRLIVESICAMHNLCIEFGDEYLEQAKEQYNFSWGATWSADSKGNEKDRKGLQRRLEIMDTMPVIQQDE